MTTLHMFLFLCVFVCFLPFAVDNLFWFVYLFICCLFLILSFDLFLRSTKCYLQIHWTIIYFFVFICNIYLTNYRFVCIHLQNLLWIYHSITFSTQISNTCKEFKYEANVLLTLSLLQLATCDSSLKTSILAPARAHV